MRKEEIDEFWYREYFGCSLTEFEDASDKVYPHHYLRGYNGLFILKVNDKYIISAPENQMLLCEKLINRGYDLLDERLLSELLSNRFERIIGPSWIGYPFWHTAALSAENIRIYNRRCPEREMLFSKLRNACSSGEWSDCGINSSSENVAALIADGEIVSAASYELWGEHIAHIGIITHPLFRGRGYAGKVLSYLTNFIFDQGLIPQYRTLCLNKPAISVARQCGYGQYAAHISVRLKR